MASMSAFGRVLRPPAGVARVEPMFLDTYLVLYDMLNDDDEELRNMAAATASWILSYSTVCPLKTVSLAPLNASRLLVRFITGNYEGSGLLCHKVLQYVCGRTPRISDSLAKASIPAPVANLVTEYRKDSTVLFVEEKQNLFIDEVREVDIWASILPETLHDCGNILNDTYKWISEGLVYLLATVNDAESDGLLGWTSKPEILTLGVRIISIAGALISRKVSAKPALTIADQRALKEKLELLLRGGSRAFWNEEWLLRIKAAVEDS